MLESIGDVSSVADIETSAFSCCSSLTDEDFCFGGALKSIGYNAFEGCYGLKNIVIPENVTDIKTSAFSFCSFETVRFECPYRFGELSVNKINEVTYVKEIQAIITFGVITNIYDDELPEVYSYATRIPDIAEIINFAGTKEEFTKRYKIMSESITVNYNFVFDGQEN